MLWWIIGVAVWVCPAVVVGTALHIAARRRAREEQALGFWWDAQATVKVWHVAEAAGTPHRAAGAVADVSKTGGGPDPAASAKGAMGAFRSLLPPTPPAATPTAP
jgi:hypothetical protein